MMKGNPHGEPVPGRYRHYKGGEYQVIGTARHSETDELLVVLTPTVAPSPAVADLLPEPSVPLPLPP